MTFVYGILGLGLIVLVHETGHFIAAKITGVKVEAFSIGMGPLIFKRKPKNSETTYSLRLFPIGGFVSMAGEDIEIDKNICFFMLYAQQYYEHIVYCNWFLNQSRGERGRNM